MCGIFGLLFSSPCSTSFVVDAALTGLRRLEYRGYDSSGVAWGEPGLELELELELEREEATTRPHTDLFGKGTRVVKAEGNISQLEKALELYLSQENDRERKVACVSAIAHTRWATHGVPSTLNSHPQVSNPQADFAVVHNGIITNYRALKEFLISQGEHFVSETDTEVIPKLCKYIHERSTTPLSFKELVSQVVRELEGAFALLFKSNYYPGELVGCKCGSPLLLGIKTNDDDDLEVSMPSPTSRKMMEVEQGGVGLGVGGDKQSPREFYFASDASAIIEHTKRVVVMEDNDLVHLKDGGYSVYSLQTKRERQTEKGKAALTETNRVLQTLEIGVEQIMKGGYDHFMQKEIHEQPEALIETMRGRLLLHGDTDLESPGMSAQSLQRVKSLSARSSSEYSEDRLPFIKLGGLEEYLENIVRSRRLIFIACGTSFHACVAARQLVEELTCLPVTLELASDLLDRNPPLFRDDTCFFVSQSGETADTLKALNYAKSKGSLCIGITNTVGSSISRETDCGVHVNAGCEIGVASTKAYTCQIVVIVMIALKLSEDSLKRSKRCEEIMNDLLELPNLVRQVLQEEDKIKDLAEELAKEKSLLAFGRGYNYATALELALKVKELSYMHSEGILAGELKHGPLALIDEHMPAVVIATRDSLREKMWSTIQQLLARKGRLILLVSKDDSDMSDYFSSAKSRLIQVPTVTDCLQTIVNIIPFQLLSYHLTVLRGFNVDQPRNLAKSVTVE